MTEKFHGVRRRRIPEVLAPAGNLDTLKTAFDFGADAVYCAGKEFGMRTAPKNFSLEDFEDAVSYAHARNGRVFVTCNILPSSDEVAAMNAYMGQLAEIGVDGLIVTDIGVLMAARKVAPHTEIHVSTQAGITNFQAANAFAELGASRVVLARELSLADIREIRANTPPELEIEAFVHGSMCMAFSGRCLISKHTIGRDANHGDCVQSCRYRYHVVEERKPNEFIPVEITGGGTFIFNSNDMNMIEHVDDVLDAGVTSLKIEGRAKSAYYVAAMANAYKTAVNEYLFQRGFIDATGTELRPFRGQVTADAGSTGGAATGRGAGGDAVCAPPMPVQFSPWLAQEPYKVTHRTYSTGFYYPSNPASEEVKVGGYINTWLLAGIVTRYDAAAQRVWLQAKNKVTPGTQIEFLFPGSPPVAYLVPENGITDSNGEPVAEINYPTREFAIPCPHQIPVGAMVRVPSNRTFRAG